MRRDGKLRLDGPITRHYPLASNAKAFRALEAGEVARGVLTFNGG